MLSDMPQTTKGSWFLHCEQKMNTELIDTIKGTIFKIWQTKQRIADLKQAHKKVLWRSSSRALSLSRRFHNRR